jgi:hypothetical protein
MIFLPLNMKLSVGQRLAWVTAAAQLLSTIPCAQALDAATIEGAGAAAQVGPVSAAGASYFGYETRQLTDEVVHLLYSNPDLAGDARLFDFDHKTDTDEEARSGAHHHRRCKVFPGDDDWPSKSTWDKFERLLGGKGTLIPTTPIAAPCYPDRKEYSPEKCEEITAKWSDPYLQYVCSHYETILSV